MAGIGQLELATQNGIVALFRDELDWRYLIQRVCSRVEQRHGSKLNGTLAMKDADGKNPTSFATPGIGKCPDPGSLTRLVGCRGWCRTFRGSRRRRWSGSERGAFAASVLPGMPENVRPAHVACISNDAIRPCLSEPI